MRTKEANCKWKFEDILHNVGKEDRKRPMKIYYIVREEE
jgi:hypothetical protein